MRDHCVVVHEIIEANVVLAEGQNGRLALRVRLIRARASRKDRGAFLRYPLVLGRFFQIQDRILLQLLLDALTQSRDRESQDLLG